MDLKKFLDRHGKVSSAKISNIDIDSKNYIINETKFLYNSPSISIRIKAILANINEHEKCEYCESYLKYSKHHNEVFVTCKCSGYRKNYDHSGRIEKFKNSIKERKKNFKQAPILPIDEVKRILKENFNDIVDSQYSMKYVIDSNPGLRESIFYYASDVKSIIKKIHYILKKPECIICGHSPTGFISKYEGYSDRCKLHKATHSRIQNKLKCAIDNFKDNGYDIITVPDSIQESFTLKCKNGHIFDRIVNNGKIYSIDDKLCNVCYPKSVSSIEYEICDFLQSHNIKYVSQYPIDRYKNGISKIDIFIPDHNIGIEYNGALWHSYGKSKYSKFNNVDKEDKNYHLNRTMVCEKNNIQLLHIFDFEWEQKQDIWKSMILIKCGISDRIYARKCKIVDVSNEVYKQFVQDNHMQGYAPASIILGLEYNGKLVSVMSFSKNRFSKKSEWELIRYCSILNTNIIGGFSKLLKGFVRTNNGSVLSYANRRWSVGNVYEKNGFVLLNSSKPNYWYLDKDLQPHSRLKFQKHIIDDGSGKTESEIMFDLGYRRLWDCGNLVYLYSND